MNRTCFQTRLRLPSTRSLVERIDSVAERDGLTRSSVVDKWLQLALYRQLTKQLDLSTVAYYESLSDAQRLEDDDWSLLSSRQLFSLDLD